MAIRVKPGTKIRWQSRAYDDRQEGVYVGYCKSCVIPETVCSELLEVPSSRKRFGNPSGTSENDRVIVKVPRFHSITQEALAPHYFGPRVSAVTHAYLEGQWIKIVPKQVEWINASSNN